MQCGKSRVYKINFELRSGLIFENSVKVGYEKMAIKEFIFIPGGVLDAIKKVILLLIVKTQNCALAVIPRSTFPPGIIHVFEACSALHVKCLVTPVSIGTLKPINGQLNR